MLNHWRTGVKTKILNGGKELGKCTHQWTTNDEKSKQALSTFSVSIRLKKKDRQQQKEERSREEDRREGGNQTGSTGLKFL